jgi:hypothetical protein
MGQPYRNETRSGQTQTRHLHVPAVPFMRQNKYDKLKVYAVTLYKINNELKLKDLQQKPLTEVIPTEYHKFLPLFDKVIAEDYHHTPHMTTR